MQYSHLRQEREYQNGQNGQQEIKNNLQSHETSLHQQIQQVDENNQPLVLTDSDRYLQEDEQKDYKMKNERLANKNKKYIQILKKASILFHENESNQCLVNSKKAELNLLRQQLQNNKLKKKSNVLRKKNQMQHEIVDLKQKINNQNIRIQDLQLTLQVLKELNSKEIVNIQSPEAILKFQQLINEEQNRLKSNRTAEKILSIIQQQDAILMNILQIQQQLRQ